jgi:hypothetical protein
VEATAITSAVVIGLRLAGLVELRSASIPSTSRQREADFLRDMLAVLLGLPVRHVGVIRTELCLQNTLPE